jgi:hypothetical protein
LIQNVAKNRREKKTLEIRSKSGKLASEIRDLISPHGHHEISVSIFWKNIKFLTLCLIVEMAYLATLY